MILMLMIIMITIIIIVKIMIMITIAITITTRIIITIIVIIIIIIIIKMRGPRLDYLSYIRKIWIVYWEYLEILVIVPYQWGILLVCSFRKRHYMTHSWGLCNFLVLVNVLLLSASCGRQHVILDSTLSGLIDFWAIHYKTLSNNIQLSKI